MNYSFDVMQINEKYKNLSIAHSKNHGWHVENNFYTVMRLDSEQECIEWIADYEEALKKHNELYDNITIEENHQETLS